MKPFSKPNREHAFALGMSLLVAGGVGALAAASDELARDSVGLILIVFAVVGMVAHVLFTQRERRNASRIGALLAVIALPIGIALIAYSPNTPGAGVSLFGLNIDTSVIDPVRDASSLALLISGAVAAAMYGVGTWLTPSRWILPVSPRWLLVAPLYLYVGVAIRFEIPLDRWQYFLFTLGAALLCGYLGLLLHRIQLSRKVGGSLLLAGGVLLLASVPLMPFGQASTTGWEVLYLLALVGVFCVISSWYTSVGYMLLTAASIASLAGEIGSDTEWYAGALMALTGLVLIGGLFLLQSNQQKSSVDEEPLVDSDQTPANKLSQQQPASSTD